jgi:hypothetical protein
MKKLLSAIFCIAFLSGCMTMHIHRTFSVDYTTYAKRGFFLTEANSVSFEYTPVAHVEVILANGYFNGKNLPDLGIDDGRYVRYDLNSGIDALYNLATELGANGIIGLNFESKALEKRSVIVAAGMAIKITDIDISNY